MTHKTRRPTKPMQRAFGDYLRAQARLRRITRCASKDPDLRARCDLLAGHPSHNMHRHRVTGSQAVIWW